MKRPTGPRLPKQTNTLTAIDLCSGPGGVTTGYKAAGVRVLAAVDTDPDACATYSLNHPEVRLFPDDIAALDPKRILVELELKPRHLDILTACVPCQTFSTLSNKATSKSRADPRNRLVLRIVHFVKVLKPRAIVMENVPGLRDNRRFAILLGRLRRAGYGIRFEVVDAADFGVPQRRRRLVLIALRGKADSAVPKLEPTHPALRGFRRHKTVREVLRLVRRRAAGDPLARSRTQFPPMVAKRIAAIPANGGGRTSLPPALQLACHTELGASGAGSSYGRMSYDDVAPTLTTRCVTPACGRFLHPRANRPITLREAACLQTFPLHYTFEGGTMSVQSQIGNAVPPRLARGIALVVANALQADANGKRSARSGTA